MEKILVVNNDMDTMVLLKNWLEKKAYKVKYTGTREEVIDIIKDFTPKLLLVDILQQQVIDQVRENEETRNIPVLLMTGYSKRQKTADLPVDDIIEKPFSLNLLEKKIEKLIAV